MFPLIAGTEVAECPFVNLPQTVKSRWGGEGLNAEKMKECVWVRPERVVQVEFLEWSWGGEFAACEVCGGAGG